jgi:16S rRNA (uracil1498-N3)-methyltransferase
LTQLQRLTIAPDQCTDQQISLTSDQQHYLYRVLRLHAGDRFIAIDGAGHWWLAELTERPSEACLLEAIAVQTELPIPITLLMAMPKGNGMDEIVRQTTEVGVTTLVPIISDRTLLNPSAQKLDRWRRIAQEAAEQSERQIVPQIADPTPVLTALSAYRTGETLGYIAEARGNPPHLLTCLATVTTPIVAITLAIGPEGGWTEMELQQAIAQTYQPISLGQRVLRAVTAPVVAIALIAAQLESAMKPL